MILHNQRRDLGPSAFTLPAHLMRAQPSGQMIYKMYAKKYCLKDTKCAETVGCMRVYLIAKM